MPLQARQRRIARHVTVFYHLAGLPSAVVLFVSLARLQHLLFMCIGSAERMIYAPLTVPRTFEYALTSRLLLSPLM